MPTTLPGPTDRSWAVRCPSSTGINKWNCPVPVIVLAAEKRAVSFSDVFLTSSFSTKKNWIAVSNFSAKNTNIDCAFIMWPVYGRLRLSFAVTILTVPPIPSHALLPWDVAKCHSHVMPKSVACARCWWNWTSFCIAPRSRPKNNVFCSTPLSVSAFQEWGVSKIHVPYWHCVMLHQKQSRDFGDTPYKVLGQLLTSEARQTIQYLSTNLRFYFKKV